MSWLKTKNLAELNIRVWSLTLLTFATAVTLVPRSTAQAMQRGISVELAPTSSAVPVPDADGPDALIITVTDSGKFYFGIDLVTPASLVEKMKVRPAHQTQTLYIKADAKAPYASVVKVLDAAHAAGFASVTLLTTQPVITQTGKVVLPEGIEMELARRLPSATK
jgi:biopolymer transport protein ExbD